ncbi:MAG: M24 family metallopeptidase [Gammaproteobacteria bacterium]|nr:M24 family metallopeptidase [Gammaproteobacteria bacterium]
MTIAGVEAIGERLVEARRNLHRQECDALLLTIGSDLEYLTGYSALPLERLTMMVLSADPDPVLVLPALEAPGFTTGGNTVESRPWAETDDPLAIVDSLLGDAQTAAISDEAWATFVLGLQERRPGLQLRRASSIVAPMRRVKDAGEQRALVEVGAAADRVMETIQRGQIPLVGRTERDVAETVRRALLESGHESVEFVIVAAGPNAASPHHFPSEREIQPGELVLFDFGGRRAGYNSDTTRCVAVGNVGAEVDEAYQVLQAAQEAGVNAARVGLSCQDVDRAARSVIDAAGYGEQFLHRTGHGIGLNVHETPFMIEGNELPIEPGFAFSVEPGIYVEGKWGMRIEDIVIVTDGEPIKCNTSSRQLVRF